MNIKQEFYENYCFALTVTHNYLVSEHLLNKYSNSWGIVSGYYTHMTTARLLCNIGSKEYPEQHGSFFSFLKGEKSSFTGKKTSQRVHRDVLLQNLEKYDAEIETVFQKLGTDLENLKEVRNNSNYEQFIISHQFLHRDMTPPLTFFIFRLKETVLEWVHFAIDFFLKYVDSLPISGECFGLILDKHVKLADSMGINEMFSWGYKQFLQLHQHRGAEKEIIQGIDNLWEDALSLYNSKVVPVNDDFYEEIIIDNYSGKRNRINPFIDSLKGFRR